MRDVNKQLKSELSKLVNNMKMSTRNKQKHIRTQQKIKTLQKNQLLLLQRIEHLSNMVV
jgi:hypothetical protein